MNPKELADIWPYVFLIRVAPEKDGGSGFAFDYMGDALIEAYGDNMVGRDIYDSLLSTRRDPIVEDIIRVLRSKKPQLQEGEFENAKKMLIKFRRALFPLGPEGETIDYVIGSMTWKAV